MASRNKTTQTPAGVDEFLATIADPVKRADSVRLVELLTAASGEPAAMWGTSIVGFGSRHYRYASGHEGDTALIGFSPRAAALTLYLSLDLTDTRPNSPHSASTHSARAASTSRGSPTSTSRFSSRC